MNYIIFDLESTCWKNRSLNKQNEIIEIGAVKIDENRNLISEFNEFVKPKLNPNLSKFCKELTTIKHENIDTADSFKVVVKKFKDWINLSEEYVLCSWGNYDKNQLNNDCDLHNIGKDWLKNHISIKHQYAKFKNLRRPVGMKKAMNREGLKLSGKHHRGIDDARNIAKIFIAYFDKWEV